MKLGLLIFLLVIFNFFVWHSIAEIRNFERPAFYFFEVGQGDSQLVVWPNGINILIDGGPNNLAVYELEKALGPNDRYIDLVILTHPHYDHYAGLIDILNYYQVGLFIYNGRQSEAVAYQLLVENLNQANVRKIQLVEGDKIRYGRDLIKIIHPSIERLEELSVNDGSLIFFVDNQGSRALFTGDIGQRELRRLSERYDLSADILKIPHHGSKHSMNEQIAQIILPKISVVGVGRNRFGHPAKEVIKMLIDVGSSFYRTDNGTVKILVNQAKLSIFQIK